VDALRGYAYRIMGDNERAERLLVAAQDRSPQLQYRQWIAEIRTENGSPDAREDWRSLWRESDLDTIEGLDAAAWAATYQRLTTSSRELADRLAPLERLSVGDTTSLFVRGIAKVWDTTGREGWDDIGVAYDATIVPDTLERMTRFIRAIMLRAPVKDPASLARRLDELVAEKIVAVTQMFDGQPGRSALDVELDWLARRLDDDVARPAIAALRDAMDIAMRDDVADSSRGLRRDIETDPGQGTVLVSSGGPAMAEDPLHLLDEQDTTIQVALPPSWFAGLEGREETHHFFRRALPDARAAERRVGANEVVERAVRVRAEPDCEPDRVWIGPPASAVPIATVVDGQWYCPQSWLAGLTPDRRSAARPSAIPGLLTVPSPDDVIGRLGSWDSSETVARVVLRAAQDDLGR